METLLQGIPHVTVYLDDILIAGENEADHLQILEMVLKRLKGGGHEKMKILLFAQNRDVKVA